MGRPPKVQEGRARTTLLRKGQIDLLEATADRLAVDFSDGLRGALDLVSPPDPEDDRCRTLAALQLRTRVLRADAPELVPIVLAGWGGKELSLPMAAARRPALVALVSETVKILRRLEPVPPPTPDDLPGGGWAAGAPDSLLVVLACPAVRVAEFRKDGRPVVFLAAEVICPPRAQGKTPGELPHGVPERQYEAPAEALAELLRGGGPAGAEHPHIVDVSDEYPGKLGRVLRTRGFRLIWEGTRPEREPRRKR